MSLPPPAFHGLDSGKPVKIYWRNLPHWRQAGATYFAMFRLADSLPREIVKLWEDERQAWLRGMGIDPSWQYREPERYVKALARLPEDRVQEYQSRRARKEHVQLDRCHGSCVLQHGDNSQLLADALRHFEGERWWLGDFVIMPNHVHLLAQPGAGWLLEDLLGSVKKFVARRIQWPQEIDDSCWQQESYDRIVRDISELFAYRQYIRDNPRKAGLKSGQYIYHRADWLDRSAPL